MGTLTKNARFILLGAGLVGLIAVFVLPVAEIGPAKKAERFTLWQLRHGNTAIAYITVLGFLGASVVGGYAAARGALGGLWAGIGGAMVGLGSIHFVQDFARSGAWKVKTWGVWPIVAAGVVGAAIGLWAATRRDPAD